MHFPQIKMRQGLLGGYGGRQGTWDSGTGALLSWWPLLRWAQLPVPPRSGRGFSAVTIVARTGLEKWYEDIKMTTIKKKNRPLDNWSITWWFLCHHPGYDCRATYSVVFCQFPWDSGSIFWPAHGSCGRCVVSQSSGLRGEPFTPGVECEFSGDHPWSAVLALCVLVHPLHSRLWPQERPTVLTGVHIVTHRSLHLPIAAGCGRVTLTRIVQWVW